MLFLGLGVEGLEGSAGVSSRNRSKSGTRTGKGINTQCYLQQLFIQEILTKRDLIPSLIPCEFVVRNSQEHVQDSEAAHAAQGAA